MRAGFSEIMMFMIIIELDVVLTAMLEQAEDGEFLGKEESWRMGVCSPDRLIPLSNRCSQG